MRLFFKFCLLSFLLFNTNAWAGPKKWGEIVEPKHVETIKKVVKPECGYKRPLRVASGMIGNPPFAWEEYVNRARNSYRSYGFGLQIIDALSKKLGFNYISTGYPSYEEAIKGLRLGEVDVLFGVYYSTKLGTGIKQITPGYFKNVFVTFVKKGSEAEESLKDVKNFNDLMGWKGIVREEEEIFPHIKDRVKNLKVVTSAPKAFETLLNGEADYLIGSAYSIEAELRRQKLQDEIVAVGDVVFQSNFFFTFSTNTNCSKMMSDFSRELKENGLSNTEKDTILRQVIDDWGERFREEDGLIERKAKEALSKEEEKAKKAQTKQSEEK